MTRLKTSMTQKVQDIDDLKGQKVQDIDDPIAHYKQSGTLNQTT
jgi:hypothetical protein